MKNYDLLFSQSDREKMIQGSWFIFQWNPFFIDRDSFFLLKTDFFRFLECVSCFGTRAGMAV